MSNRPNILIFNVDEYRAEALGHLGNPAAVTPNFDRITKTDGVSFRNAFCQNPVCTPSRCSFMSGWYPHVRGHRTMYYMMHEDEPVLLRRLKEEGYFVFWAGRNDMIPAGASNDQYCNLKFRGTGKNRRHRWTDYHNKYSVGDKDYYSMYLGKLDKKGEDEYYDHDIELMKKAYQVC